MTGDSKAPSPFVKRKHDDPPPPPPPIPLPHIPQLQQVHQLQQLQQQIQQQHKELELERIKLEEERLIFEKVKKDLRELLESNKVYDRVDSYSKKRGSTAGLSKSDSKETLARREKEIKEKEREKDREREREKEKDKEKLHNEKEKKKKEKNKEKKEKKSNKMVKEIGTPYNIQHKTHVDFDYKWTGQDPDQVFELTQKLGEGYVALITLALHRASGAPSISTSHVHHINAYTIINHSPP
jgi:hypothetical protein